jgi:hypothetical protein
MTRKQGSEDPKGFTHGGTKDLRDPKGGTYGDNTPSGTPQDIVIQVRTPHQNAQQGADVRSEPLVVSNELPEGLQRERKGPLNPRSGRRETAPKR